MSQMSPKQAVKRAERMMTDALKLSKVTFDEVSKMCPLKHRHLTHVMIEVHQELHGNLTAENDLGTTAGADALAEMSPDEFREQVVKQIPEVMCWIGLLSCMCLSEKGSSVYVMLVRLVVRSTTSISSTPCAATKVCPPQHSGLQPTYLPDSHPGKCEPRGVSHP